MRFVNLAALAMIAYNVGHGDLMGAVGCAGIWGSIWLGYLVQRGTRAPDASLGRPRPHPPAAPRAPFDWASLVDDLSETG